MEHLGSLLSYNLDIVGEGGKKYRLDIIFRNSVTCIQSQGCWRDLAFLYASEWKSTACFRFPLIGIKFALQPVYMFFSIFI